MRVAINGFGRIGRTLGRLLAQQSDIQWVAVNDLMDEANMEHLLKYDSVHRTFPGHIEQKDNYLKVNDQFPQIFHEANPEDLPWDTLNVDVVIECTGRFRSKEAASAHLRAGAKKVILSAPATDKETKTLVLGINDDILTADDLIISNASCTTNSAAPMVKIVEDHWGIEQGYITTVHSYTGDQRLHDAPHKDLRRARAGALNIVPTTTGAAKAITRIFPHLEGKLGGCGIRVPVPDGSLTDITFTLKNKTTVEEVNKVFESYANGSMKNILQVTYDPIVSVDFRFTVLLHLRC